MNNNILTKKIIISIVIVVLSFSLFAQKTISVYSGEEIPLLEFAMADLRNELNSQGITISNTAVCLDSKTR